MRPQFQLALDLTDPQLAFDLCAITSASIDWIEAGTPLVIAEGLAVVREMRSRFPQKTIVADIKIADAAKLLATQAIQSGANILTVLSAASDTSIRTCVELAHRANCKVIGDHISSQPSLDACHRLAGLGVDYAGVHIPKDSEDRVSLGAIEKVVRAAEIPIVLAGGIQVHLLDEMVGWPVGAVVVGGAVINSSDPAREAAKIAAVLARWET